MLIDLRMAVNDGLGGLERGDLSNLLSEVNYTDPAGSYRVRETVARYVGQLVGTPINPETLFLTNGADQAISTALQAIGQIRSGSVYVQAPRYYKYPDQIRLFHHGDVKSQSMTDNLLDAAPLLTAAQDSGVSAVVFNNPNNPLGYIQPQEVLSKLLAYSAASKVQVLYDIVYADTLFHSSDSKHIRLPDGHEAQENLWIVGSLSKSHGVAGWRLGFLICPSQETKRVEQIMRLQSSNVSTVNQFLMNEVLVSPAFKQRQEQLTARMAANFEGIVKHVREHHPSLLPRILKPSAGMFFCLNAQGFYGSEEDIEKALKNDGFLVLRGSDFGWPFLLRLPLIVRPQEYAPFFRSVEKFLPQEKLRSFNHQRPQNLRL
jgi:arginine:pyruvate transaminase